MGSLYECLCEARLDKFYQTLRSHGYADCKSLLNMTSQECSVLGITSLPERQRLFELINIIRSVNDSESYDTDDDIDNASQSNRKRNRRVYYTNTNQSSNPHVSKPATPRRIQPTVTMQTVYRRIQQEDAAASAESTSDDEPATKHSNTLPSSPNKKSHVELIHHATGYDYGVPRKYVQTNNSPKNKTSGEPRIKVCIRKRPLVKREIKNSEFDVVVVPCSSTIHIKEPKVAVDLTPYTLTHEFMFDEVFGEQVTNENVYEKTAKPLIEKIFRGGKATCFAFGQTGAGKTHTMLGDQATPGLYLLAATDIFERIRSQPQYVEVRVWVSFFEIYCGQLFDLLNKRNRLHAREDGSQRVCIAGLTETSVSDVNSIMKVLDYGNTVRRKGSTGVNTDSSRSHAILQLELRDARDNKLGRMSFIDLAGSERASEVTGSDKQTRIEGAEINQSLLALKECIRAIDQDTKHTPFRQSKLTHILKESFMGDSVTCMIANISPVQSACENSLNTLRYAHRVKELKRDMPNEVRPARPSSTTSTRNITMATSSIFQPSNVLQSSTPLRSQSTRSYPTAEVASVDTPIRGHIPKVTRAKRKTPIRHTPCVSSDTRLLRMAANASSPSSSDKSDSCNLNVMSEAKVNVLPTVEQNGGVVNASDPAGDDSNDTDGDLTGNGDLNNLNDLSSSPINVGVMYNVGEDELIERDADVGVRGGVAGAYRDARTDAGVPSKPVNDGTPEVLRLGGDGGVGMAKFVSDTERKFGFNKGKQCDKDKNRLNKVKCSVSEAENTVMMLMEGSGMHTDDAVLLAVARSNNEDSLRGGSLDSDLLFGSATLPKKPQEKRADSLVQQSARPLSPTLGSDAGKSNAQHRVTRPHSATVWRDMNEKNLAETSYNNFARPLFRRNLPHPGKSIDNSGQSEMLKSGQKLSTDASQLLTATTRLEDIEGETYLKQYCDNEQTSEGTPKDFLTDVVGDRAAVTAHSNHDTKPDQIERTESCVLTKTSSPVVRVEKLESNSQFSCDFSPIHTSISRDSSATMAAPAVVTKDVIHRATNDSVITSGVSSQTSSQTSASSRVSHDYRRALTSPLPRDYTAARLHVVTAHEEQLAKTTGLCKQEMKLLLGIKADSTYATFDDYLGRVDSILTLKLRQVQLMKDMIVTFRRANQLQPPQFH